MTFSARSAADATAFARDRGLALRAWLPRAHPYRRTLIEEGFLRTGEGVDMRFLAHSAGNPGCAFLAAPDAAIHLTPGDTDHV